MNEQFHVDTRAAFFAEWDAARAKSASPNDHTIHGSSSSYRGVSPYPGLRSFQPDEADLFYGRGTQIKELRDRLTDHNVIVVLGGSGSGKSSLVRAGLIPQLNSTAPIAGRAGAWYVVEFRPKTDPVTELFEALFNQIVAPVLTPRPTVIEQSNEIESPRAAWVQRIAALNSAFGLQCDPDASPEVITDGYRKRLREKLFEGDVIDVGALFDFVDETLQEFDRALSGGMVSAAPNLLILIDQFEEVFKPKVASAGHDTLMSLINSAHTYKPFHLFIVVTMRSEELHRCAEVPGLADVVNRSLYLVDLIGGKDVEHAIVGPARRLMKSWELDAGAPETGPYTRRALSKLHRIFDEARDRLSHPADQLPLMQHMLPLVWDNAVTRWRATTGNGPLEIDLRDLDSLAGWDDAEGALIGTLNARADWVLQEAIKVGTNQSKLTSDTIERLLRVAFSCLAQLDDRGNVVRDFATLDQMLAASGVYERETQAKQIECGRALQAAIDVFRRATLVNVSRAYDVNHEALIRGWKRYTGWLLDAQRRAARLIGVDQQLQRKATVGDKGAFAGWIDSVTDWILVQNLSKADQIVGDETSKDLMDVVGNNRTFSDQWATTILEKQSNSPESQQRQSSLTNRLTAIRTTINNAIRFRDGARYRPRNILAALLAAAAVLVGWMYLQHMKTTEQEQLAGQFRFFRLQNEATSPPDASSPRYPGKDRETYVALAMEPALGNKALSDEATIVLHNSMRSLEQGARAVLSDVSVRVVPNGTAASPINAELAALAPSPSECAIVDPEHPRDLFTQRDLGIQLKRVELANGVPTIQTFPVWRTSGGDIFPIESSNFTGQPLPAGSLLCLSHDANWLLMWPPLPEEQNRSPPLIQRIMWIRTAPRMAAQDQKWHAETNPHRRPTTWQSYEALQASANPGYADLISSVHNNTQPIKSFHAGDRVGFLLPLKSQQTAIVWTAGGTLNPDSVDDKWPAEPSSCAFVLVERPDQIGRPQTRMNCNMGSFTIEGRNHRLQAEFDERTDSPGCKGSAQCVTELQIVFDPPDSTGTPLRTTISHRSSRVIGATIAGGYLWVRDANGQSWRYSVGSSSIMPLFEHRWRDVDQAIFEKIPYSNACQVMTLNDKRCDDYKVPGWPSP
ncbi:hypothetical protein HNR60_002810 [Rhodopseudomonas rhenobacensis]|uniref:Novel STAND NTPase 1 domain-containing protein n=1 Tax=Rhodopseudomonas rhenobacensis TaxID=87461 RepID=A0A7W8DZ70_9BRAD|nr:AAA family ATPase [Rhodopseudomonas rhenobacensis]MBB5048049.1 hypothetical protein [Rhodopseudomonas rhenobacensis]